MKFFSISKKTIVVNNVDKEILSVNIVIGSPDKSLINKQIDLKNKVRDKDKDAQDIKDLVANYEEELEK